MKYKIPAECPTCGGDFKVTRLECEKCKTEIKGEFVLDELFQLSQDQLDFLKLFIRARGSIKEVEKEMDMSYPTVRNKLNELITALGYEEPGLSPQERKEERKKILDQLEKGEIKTDQAIENLKEL